MREVYESLTPEQKRPRVAVPDATVAVRELLADVAERLHAIVATAKAPAAAGLQLSQRDCTELDDRLGLGSTQSGERLLAAIDRLASVRIGDIRIPFTPGQVAELQHRAMKRGRSVEMEIRAVVTRIEDELFYKGG